MKPVIVLITDSRDPSGLGTHMLALAKGLTERFEPVIACPGDTAGLALLKRAARDGLRIKAFDLNDLTGLQAWLKASGAALLHVHAGIGWEGHALVRCGKASGLPVVRTEHLPYLLTSVVQQAEYRAMLLSVDARIAVSLAVQQSHDGKGGGKQSVIPNGIWAGAGQHSAGEVRDALGFSATDRIILTVARLTEQKGHASLIAAAPTILAAHPNAKFVFAGEGPEREALEVSIAQHGLTDSFRLLGNRNDVEDLLAASDLFVLPSYFEGLPLALLEAMAAGVPVVATRIGGTVEAIGASHPFLVPAGDAAALGSAIVDALSDAGAASHAAELAHARFGSNFTAVRMAAQTSAIYADLLPSVSRTSFV